MRVVLGFVGGVVVGFLTLSWLGGNLLGLFGFDRRLEGVWPLLCGIVGAWLAAWLGGEAQPYEFPK